METVGIAGATEGKFVAPSFVHLHLSEIFLPFGLFSDVGHERFRIGLHIGKSDGSDTSMVGLITVELIRKSSELAIAIIHHLVLLQFQEIKTLA